MDNINEIKIKSDYDNKISLLQSELLERIEKIEDQQRDIMYFLNNPNKLTIY
tara:strand:+ start:330 stop:485 length:156 start_codon:yes stop_codon:yes gene_type:complete